MERLYKSLLLIKWENIALLLFIPIAIIQLFKASLDMKLLSVVMSLVLYGGAYIVIYLSRMETLQELKRVKPITTKTIENALFNLFNSIKKEINISTRYKDDQVQYKKCF